MALSSSHAFITSHRLVGGDNPRDPELFTADDIGTYLGIGASSSAAASTADSKGTSAGTQASTADSKAISDSVNISVALSTAQAGSGSATSVADSKAVSAGSQAGIADSKAVSDSINTSTADSKAESVAAALVTDVGASVADSKATSSGLRASVADSKAVSDSVVVSTLQTTADSKVLSNSVLISTADSKAVSDSVVTSTLQTTADSKIVSTSVNVSIADSKAVSDATKSADKTVTPKILGSSGTASSASSSLTEVNHAAIKIPAGTMGANGKVWFIILFKFVGTAAAKTINVRLSTTSGDTSVGDLIFSFATGATALAYWLNGREFQNSNSASAQIFYRALAGGQGSDANAPATAAINTANDAWLNINGFVTNAGDTFQVVSYSVVFFPGV